RKILTLPGDAAQISLQATLVDQRDTAPRLHGRILVVDDEPDIVTILTKYFTDVGLSVDAASHGGDALIAVSQYRPDVVLLDVLMEGLNGVQVLERIRALDPAIRVIMISGSGDSTLRPLAQAGAPGRPRPRVAHTDRLLDRRARPVRARGCAPHDVRLRVRTIAGTGCPRPAHRARGHPHSARLRRDARHPEGAGPVPARRRLVGDPPAWRRGRWPRFAAGAVGGRGRAYRPDHRRRRPGHR